MSLFVNINKRTRLYSGSARLLNEPKKIVQVCLFSLTNEHKRAITELVHERFVERSVRLHPYLSYQLSLWLLQISRLIFTNSGNAILALASNAIHLLWKWQRSDRNSNGKVQGYQNGFHSSFVNFFLNKRIFWNDLYCNIILLLHSVGNCQCTTSVVATIKWHSYDKWCCWYKSGRGCTLFCFIQEWFLCNVSIWRKDFLV